MRKRSLPLVPGVCAFLLNSPCGGTESITPAGESNTFAESTTRENGFTPWLRAEVPRDWQFPRDHGAHPEYRTEWWYIVSNLRTKDGRRFGAQITFFRHGLSSRGRHVPYSGQQPSPWRADDVHFAHFAITDEQGNRHLHAERINRPAYGRAGASETSVDVRNADWHLRGEEAMQGTGDADSPFSASWHAAYGDFSATLRITAAKPLVFQGERGLSQKSADVGNASHYYSFTRLATTGEIRIGEETFAVEGWSWMDREFSTSALGADQRGWDWFAIQLDNNTEIMLYHMRRADGTYDPLSKGLFIHPDATTTVLSSADFEITALNTWRSPKTGGTYPSGWRVKIPSREIDITITPLIKNQELILPGLGNLSYWEGACNVGGTVGGSAVTGAAYVELTGYAGDIAAAMRR
jgi:predicted secreted hydrolase